MRRKTESKQQIARRKQPLVWVKRIVLYETIDPLTVLRRVDFTKGLNIIQGEASESVEAFQSGHGIGKTTVCRLIRYCLGEKTYGQKHVVEEVTHCFPNAYVGAEIELNGTTWAVLRPLGNRLREYALEGITLDDLIQAEGPRRFDDFAEKLAESTLSEIPVTETLTSGQTLQWLHVLAMCSRDQESRYDRFWTWRHTRSESGTSKFNKPKVDAGLCVRAMMGLLDPAEPKLRAKLERLEAALERVRNNIKENRAEPGYHITRLRRSLEADFGVDDAVEAPLDAGNLLGLINKVRSRLDDLHREMSEIDDRIAPLDRQISLTSASLLEPAELAQQQQAASEITGDGNGTLLADIERLRNLRQSIRDSESALCRYGGVVIGSCNYATARLGQLDDEVRELQRATLPTVSEREQVAARLGDQAERLQSTLGQIRHRLDEMNRQKNDLLQRRFRANEQIQKIPPILTEIEDWTAILVGTRPNTAIQGLEREAETFEAEIEATKASLVQLIAAQEERARGFESRFDAVVRQTLTEEFRGVVQLNESGVHFSIKRGGSLSGEAFDTLTILLADLTLLFESDSPYSHHPGLLIHDSPREADLSLQIYRRLLDVAHARFHSSGDETDTAFQYIVTTTTLPSPDLQGMSVTKLKLGSGPASLFGRQLESPVVAQPQTPLFDDEDRA